MVIDDKGINKMTSASDPEDIKTNMDGYMIQEKLNEKLIILQQSSSLPEISLGNGIINILLLL